MGFLATGGILNRKGFFGGALAQPAFSPLDISGLKLWVSADYGVTTASGSYISQIVISGCDPSSSNGTYTRASGGNSTFNYNDNSIYFEDGVWWLNDFDQGLTFLNEADLDEGSWDVALGNSFGTASNTTSNFNYVSEVLDQSGNSNNLVYSYGAPDISLNILNSKPAFYFFGGRLEGTDIVTAKTIYSVIKLGGGSPSGYMNILEASGGGLYTSINNNEWGSYFSDFNGSGEQLSADTAYIISTISDDGETYKFRSNGSQIKTDSNGGGFYGRDTLYFGNDSSHGQPANCYVAETLVYDTAISDADAEKLENYLNSKYAVY